MSKSNSSGSTTGELTAAEKDRYDRQIRLWGAAAQSRLQNSKILVCGLYGCQIESLKNLVLTGVNADIYDNEIVCADDLSYNFFLIAEDVGKRRVDCALPKIKDLNNLASISECSLSNNGCTGGLLGLTAEAVAAYSVLLLADCYSKEELLHVSRLCDSAKVQYFVSGGAFLDAWFISCLGSDYQFKNDPPNNKELRTFQFPTLTEITEDIPGSSLVTKLHPVVSPVYLKARVLLAFCDEAFVSRTGTAVTAEAVRAELMTFLESFIASEGLPKDCFTPDDVDELCAVAKLRNKSLSNGRYLSNPIVVHSIVGSFLSQEVIKVLSLVGEPMFNIFAFSSLKFEGKVFPAKKPAVSICNTNSSDCHVAKKQRVEEVEIFEL